jgi:hypothetical protein
MRHLQLVFRAQLPQAVKDDNRESVLLTKALESLAKGVNVPDFPRHFRHFGKRGKRSGILHSGIQIFPPDGLIQRAADNIVNLKNTSDTLIILPARI